LAKKRRALWLVTGVALGVLATKYAKKIKEDLETLGDKDCNCCNCNDEDEE